MDRCKHFNKIIFIWVIFVLLFATFVGRLYAIDTKGRMLTCGIGLVMAFNGGSQEMVLDSNENGVMRCKSLPQFVIGVGVFMLGLTGL